jgi:hypothetical protein
MQMLIGNPLFSGQVEIPYSEFKQALRAGEVKSVTVEEEQISGVMKVDE